MAFSTARDSLVATISPPSPREADGTTVVQLAALLTGLLFIAVPIATVVIGVPSLVAIAFSGTIYAVILVYANDIFEGLCGAVLVLCTFSANFPIYEVPITLVRNSPQLNLMLVDVAAIPLALMFVYRSWPSFEISVPRGGRVVVYALTGFVVWSILAAIVSNGPSRLVALLFVVEQLRYLVLFIVAVGIARYVGIRSAIYSLLIAVGANMAFAIAEAINQASFGLTYLGDVGGGGRMFAIDTFSIGPLTFEASLYAGGFVGSSRALVAVALLIAPAVLAVVVRTRKNSRRILGVSYLLAWAFVVRISQTDAGFGALIITIALMIVALTYIVFKDTSSTQNWSEYVSGYVSTLSIGILGLVLRLKEQAITGKTSSGGEMSNGGTPSGGASASEGVTSNGGETPTSETSQQAIDSILSHVPLISTGSLSIRIQQYVAAIVVATQYPLFGVGGMNFPLISESYGLPKPYQIHNVYMSHLASTGIPGVVLFLVAIIAVLGIVLNRVTTESENRLLWALLACGMVGFHAINFWAVTHVFPPTYMTFWTLAGVVVGATFIDQNESTASAI